MKQIMMFKFMFHVGLCEVIKMGERGSSFFHKADNAC